MTYPLKGAEAGLADRVVRDSIGGTSEMAESEPLEEPPLFSTLLALLINLASICGLSSGPPDPPWAEELILYCIREFTYQRVLSIAAGAGTI